MFQITKMLLLVSTIFLLLNLPSHAIRVFNFFMEFSNKNYTPPFTMILCQQFFTILYNCNFGINFILYSVCGKNFRKSLRSLMKKMHNKLRWFKCPLTSSSTLRHASVRLSLSNRFSGDSMTTQRSNMLSKTQSTKSREQRTETI